MSTQGIEIEIPKIIMTKINSVFNTTFNHEVEYFTVQDNSLNNWLAQNIGDKTIFGSSNVSIERVEIILNQQYKLYFNWQIQKFCISIQIT